MGTLKFVNLDYKREALIQETIVLLGLCLLESIRIHLGRKGSLSDHGETLRCSLTPSQVDELIHFSGYQVWLSVIFIIPVLMGVIYLLCLQTHVLKLEYILCALMLLLQVTELVFAILFIFSLCKPPTYD